jgi:hypothetical protein
MLPTPRATKRTSAQSNHPICALKSSSTACTALLWLATHKQTSLREQVQQCRRDRRLQPGVTQSPEIHRVRSGASQACPTRRTLIDLVPQAPGSRPYFDFERLVNDHVFVFFSRFSQPIFPILQVEVTRVVTRNLNAVIDVNYYPVRLHSSASPNGLHVFLTFDF